MNKHSVMSPYSMGMLLGTLPVTIGARNSCSVAAEELPSRILEVAPKWENLKHYLRGTSRQIVNLTNFDFPIIVTLHLFTSWLSQCYRSQISVSYANPRISLCEEIELECCQK